MTRVLIRLTLLALLALPGLTSAKPAVPSWRDAHPWSTRTGTVTIGTIMLEVELADTGPLRARGLSYRASLEPGTGMLFVFPDTSVQSFWMRGMRFCLDIVWINDRTITGAAENVCPMPSVAINDLPRYSSSVPVNFVLEVPAGWMEMNGFGAGTSVEISLPDQPEP